MRHDDNEITLLGYALLGLANGEPRSGYALRKVFETTAMGRFSSSPGSIYPALKKLERAGLIEARQSARSTRARYHVTAKGKRALSRWLARPVDVNEYDRNPEGVLLRFAFLDALNDLALTLRFLDSFESAAKENLARLKAFLRSEQGRALSRHAALAVEHGVGANEAALRWARRATRVIAAQERTKGR